MLRIQSEQDPTIKGVVVTLVGEATMDAAELLSQKLTFVTAGRPAAVIIDCTTLTILTSICIGELVAFKKGIAPAPVVLAAASPFVSRSLQFARLDQVFNCYDSLEAARAALQK